MQRFMIYVLMIYAIIFLLGMNFFLVGLELDLLGSELLLFLLVTILPGIFILVYAFKANIGNLEKHEKALHYLIYIALTVAVAVVSVIVTPMLLI
jgi:hypothetical protein